MAGLVGQWNKLADNADGEARQLTAMDGKRPGPFNIVG